MTIERLLAECLQPTSDGRARLTLAPRLQGFPDTAHGGGVLAVFDLAASRGAGAGHRRSVSARIEKRVPLGTPLLLAARPGAGRITLTLQDGRRRLADGFVTDALPVATDGRSGRPGPREEGFEVPTARGCLACGTDNPLGLRVRLRFNPRWVWVEYEPPDTYRTADGKIAPALFTVLLDEMAWWLGALTAGEAGVTTEITVVLHRPAQPFGGPLLAFGPRDRVTAADERGHFWTTETAVLASDGTPLATARITFAASRVYSKRLIPLLLDANPPERVHRIFPGPTP
jgi:hypothetical protein